MNNDKRKRRVIYVNEYSTADEKRNRDVVYRKEKEAEDYALSDLVRRSRWVEDLKFRDEWDREQKK